MKNHLKTMHKMYQEDDSLPPLDNNDDFFTAFTSSQKHQYVYHALKKALKMFILNKHMVKIQTEKIIELEARIKKLESQIQKHFG
jgi:hypothetical protein